MKLQKDYEELLKLFNKHKVAYCIVGAYAVAFHARPRFTKDLDILAESDLENGKKIIKALKEFGFQSRDLSAEDFSKEGKIIQLGYEPVRVDIVTSIDGCTFEEIWKNRKAGFYGKQKVFFIGIKELIKNKKVTGRRQDEADLEVLKKARSAVPGRSYPARAGGRRRSF